MFNIIKKSVKTINSGISSIVTGITGENSYKTEVDFCKFDKLNLNFLGYFEKEKDTLSYYANTSGNSHDIENKVFYVVYSKAYLNIYLITEELELKCFFCQKMNFFINSVDSLLLPINTTYTKELPIIAIVCNDVNTNKNSGNNSQSHSYISEIKNGFSLVSKANVI